jgi:hypothetical protein
MRRLGFCAVFVLLLSFSSVRAQTPAPIIFWANGDLWTWTPDGGPIAPLTQQGTVTMPVQSPDGGLIAYRVLAPVSQAALDRLQTEGAIADFDLPTDLYLVDPAVGVPIPLAQQPDDAVLFQDGIPDRALVHSAPAWSPDGGGLAWIAFDFGAASASLHMFDRASGQIAVVIDGLPLIDGRAPELRWGRLAFAVRSADTAQPIAIYSFDGAPLATIPQVLDPAAALQVFEWIRWGDRDLLGLLTTDGRWQLFDPLTGAPVEAGVPMLHPVGDEADAAAVRFDLAPESGFFWEVVDPASASASVAYTGLPGQVAFGPDGRTLVFIGYPEFGALALWRGEAFSAVPGTGVSDAAALIVTTVFWAPMQWSLEA